MNFTPILGKISNWTNIFQMGWFNHQLDTCSNKKTKNFTDLSGQRKHDFLEEKN